MIMFYAFFLVYLIFDNLLYACFIFLCYEILYNTIKWQCSYYVSLTTVVQIPVGGGGGGGTQIFSCIRSLGLFFGAQKFEFRYFLGFQKNKYFLGYDDFVDIFFWVITKLDYI